jgi:phosphoribosylaminoimidazole carboxylase
VVSYPVVETIQKDSVCDVVIAPAQVSSQALDSAMDVAKAAISQLQGLGIFGVELFLLPDDSVLLNEIAPRPHNSGHYTMEACDVDQFEMHLRCILGLPCPVPAMRVGVALMKNVLGGASMDSTMAICKKALEIPGAGVHWYGKAESRLGRKMAHITLTAQSIAQLRQKADLLGLEPTHGLASADVRVGIIMGSDSDLSTMKDAADVLDEFDVPYEITIVSAHRTPSRMYTYAQSAVERGIQVIIAGAGGAAHLPGMVAALTSLPVIGVPVKTSTLSGNDSLLSIVQMPKGRGDIYSTHNE